MNSIALFIISKAYYSGRIPFHFLTYSSWIRLLLLYFLANFWFLRNLGSIPLVLVYLVLLFFLIPLACAFWVLLCAHVFFDCRIINCWTEETKLRKVSECTKCAIFQDATSNIYDGWHSIYLTDANTLSGNFRWYAIVKLSANCHRRGRHCLVLSIH